MQDEMLAVIRGESFDVNEFYQSLTREIRAHSESVSRLAAQILKWAEDEHVQGFDECPKLCNYEHAVRYHDIGFTLIPERIYCKTEELTSAEYRVIQQHAIYGGRVLDNYRRRCKKDTEFWKLAAEIALQHHERWDGKGYPYGQCTTAISFAARIVSIADSFDSMVRGSHYRMKLPVEFAMLEIIQNAGRQFDPFLAELFRSHYDTIAKDMTSDGWQ